MKRTFRLFLLLVAAATSAFPARAERASDLINFAFAARLGSGIYQTSGGTLWILRVPASATVARARRKRARYGASLLLPVTVGILDFEPEDILESGLPDRFDSLGFTPGVRFDVPAGTVWTLSPFAQGGPVRNYSTDRAVATEAPRARLRIRPFADPSPHRTIALVWRRRYPLADSLRRLAGTLRSAYPRPSEGAGPAAARPRRRRTRLRRRASRGGSRPERP